MQSNELGEMKRTWDFPPDEPSPHQIRVSKLMSYVNKIDDKILRDYVCVCLFFAPRSYWLAPSSTSGKYHPKDEFCEGGQLIHVLRALGYSEILMEIDGPLYQYDKDIIYASVILHDIAKFGLNDIEPLKTYTEHGMLAEAVLRQVAKYYVPIAKVDLDRIICCIISHHGRWGEIHPSTLNGLIVHTADAIAANYMEEK